MTLLMHLPRNANLLIEAAIGLCLSCSLSLSWLYSKESSLTAIAESHLLLLKVLCIIVVLAPLCTGLVHMLFRAIDSFANKRTSEALDNIMADIKHEHRSFASRQPSIASRLLFESHPYIAPLIVLAVIYYAHLVIVAPGIFSQEDTKDQLLAFFNLSNFRADQVNLLSPDILLTNHHPVTHTLLLGMCVQAGIRFGSANAGFLFYTTVQVTLFIMALASVFPFFRRNGIPFSLRWASLSFFALCPKLWNLSCLCTKDTLFAAAVLCFLVSCIDSLGENKGRSAPIRLFVFAGLCCLLRNNGVFLVASMLPFFAFYHLRRGYSQLNATSAILPLSTAILGYALLIMLVLPALQITGGSVRETLSVPLQQTARYLKYHSDDISSEELGVINRIADPSEMAEAYRPELADYVKNLYRKDASTDEVLEFLGLWLSLGVRHPGNHLIASVDNHYGFYCFTDSAYEKYQSTAWSREKMEIANETIYDRSDGRIRCDFHELSPQRFVDRGDDLYRFVTGLPVVAQLMQAAFYFWLLVICLAYGISRRNALMIAVSISLLTLFAISFLGPANAVGYTRYIAPAMVAAPIAISTGFVSIELSSGNCGRNSASKR